MLTTDTKSAIQKLAPANAIILGSTEKVGSTVETELQGLNIKNIERISWTTPEQLSQSIAQRILDIDSNSIIIVNSTSSVDSAIASVYGAKTRTPIILNNQSTISPELQSLLSSYTNLSNIYIIGDTTKISSTVETTLKQYADVERITGTTSEQRNINFIEKFNFQNSLNTVTRSNSSYQLFAAAEMAMFKEGTLLIMDSTEFSPNLSSFFSSYGGANVIFYGDSSQISANAYNSEDQRIGSMWP
ncbi:N-acetylmuramoyl-L-alanine amidase [Mesobacillus boroniphilus JCM 21738]|uniref:N-acetylmuramoyl-L-alanine amidase n=1 Tax=Mesobacillus boroniphilus JCM 21738 TaxID=1294265 RepID=W4RWA2_9BACI|nr:N-acetylmuramoyl-L-alanine amidase [Mesobacillus boroniphilus JCM 21738]